MRREKVKSRKKKRGGRQGHKIKRREERKEGWKIRVYNYRGKERRKRLTD